MRLFVFQRSEISIEATEVCLFGKIERFGIMDHTTVRVSIVLHYHMNVSPVLPGPLYRSVSIISS